jgi:hypothetical protein
MSRCSSGLRQKEVEQTLFELERVPPKPACTHYCAPT